MNARTSTRNHRMPILFFTQLMGLAFGARPAAAGDRRASSSTRPTRARASGSSAATGRGRSTAAAAGPRTRPRRRQAGTADAADDRRRGGAMSAEPRRGADPAGERRIEARLPDPIGRRVPCPTRARAADRRLRLPLRHEHRRHGRRCGGPRVGRQKRPRAARRGRRPRLPVHVLEPRPGAHREGHRASSGSTASSWRPARRTCTRRRSAARATGPASTRTCASWSRSASRSPGSTRTRRPPPPRPKAIVAGGVVRVRRTSAARADPRPDQPGDARRRRRHRRHHGRPRDRRRRLPGPPRREGAVDRRPHGPVRQDVPDPRLRRLHPHPARWSRRAATPTSRSTPGAR